jgi:branched-chain amino acid transport system substrate-binding protein
MSRTIALTVAIIAVVVTAVFVGGCARQPDDIIIGEYGPSQGGKTTHQGIALAIDEINASGGLLGKKVVLKSEYDTGLSSDGMPAVQKLITNYHVVGIIGPASSVAQSNKVPLLMPAGTYQDLTGFGDYIFRVCFTDDFQGGVCAVFAKRNLSLSRAAILRDKLNPHSVCIADAFKKSFTRMGGTVVIDSSYSTDARGFKSQLTAIKSANAQILFVPGDHTDISKIASQARQLGITGPLLGGDEWDSSSLVQNADGSLDGCYFTNHFSSQENRPAAVKFVESFRKTYRVEPNAKAALAYDAAWILAEAIKKAGATDGDSIRKALSEIKDYPGATGRITIDKNRNASKPAVVMQIKGKKFVRVTSIEPEQVQ